MPDFTQPKCAQYRIYSLIRAAHVHDITLHCSAACHDKFLAYALTTLTLLTLVAPLLTSCQQDANSMQACSCIYKISFDIPIRDGRTCRAHSCIGALRVLWVIPCQSWLHRPLTPDTCRWKVIWIILVGLCDGIACLNLLSACRSNSYTTFFADNFEVHMFSRKCFTR